MKKDLKIRIGIVGAGAAGLTAAEALKKKGYSNVTIIEKEKQAGGKCRSFEYQGRSYELGAGIIVENNQTIQKLVKQFGVKVKLIDFSNEILVYDIETGKTGKIASFWEKLELFRQILLTYRRLINRYKKVTEPGLLKVDPDLCVPFSDLVSTHKIDLLAKAFGLFFTGFGYGFLDQVPAAYVLKYYSWPTLKSFAKKAVYFFPAGIQGLWLIVAKNQRVLYETIISGIERKGLVRVKTGTVRNGEKGKTGGEGELVFDALIIASPLDEALQFLDASEEEKNLFSKIQYCDYRTYACIVKDFTKLDGYLPGNFVASRAGQPVFWNHHYNDSDLYTFYVLGDWEVGDDEVMENIEKIVRRQGGTLEGLYRKEHWKYFPHVGPAEMKAGYFDKIEAIQGQNNTYYTGELLSFSTVELTAEHAANLVERFF